MAAPPSPSPISGLARALIQAGKLKEADAEQLLTQANSAKVTLLEQIITAKRLTALEVARFVADTFGYPLLLSRTDV